MSDLAMTATSYTVRDVFQRAFNVCGSRIAVTAEDGPWTYAELGEQARRLAAAHRPTIAQAKTLLNASTAGSLSEALELEAGIQAALLRSEPVRRSFADVLAGRDG